MKWQRRRRTKNCAAITYAGDYVISHRPKEFTLSYRPAGEHVHLGTFKSLKLAKEEAEFHSLRLAIPPASPLMDPLTRTLILAFNEKTPVTRT